MKVTVLYNQGSQFELNEEQKITDQDTVKTAQFIKNVLSQAGHATNLLKVTPKDFNQQIENLNTDLVFNLCEWSGRDYPLAVRVIEILEKQGLNYTGADSKSYEWCSNKILMKKLFVDKKIPTPKYIVVTNKVTKIITKQINKLKFPLIMKPVYEHCGIGIRDTSVLHDDKDIAAKIEDFIKIYSQPLIIEEFIEGREFQMTLVQNGIIHALPPAEIVFFDIPGKEKIYSFGSKWEKSSEESVYAETTVLDKKNSLTRKLINLSKEVFKKLSCKGYARLDIRIKKEEIFVLEVNVNPALDPDPDYTMTASSRAIGWEYKDLVLEIAKAGILA